MPNNQPKGLSKPQKLAILLGGTAIVSLAVSMGATQYAAYRLNYHPALGVPWFTGVPWLNAVYAPWSYWLWKDMSWAANVPTTFAHVQMGLTAVGSLIAFGFLAAIKFGSRPRPIKHEGVHGTATFGDMDTLKDAGLLPPNPEDDWKGVYCGAYQDKQGTLHYLRHDGPEHVLGIGPIRSGKLVSLVIPTLTTWTHSSVVYDEKDEIGEATAAWRATEGGNKVLRWEPGAAENTVSFNFFSEVRLGTDYEFKDVANIMAIVADPKGAGLEGHWDPSAAKTLNGVVLHVCYEAKAKGRVANMSDILAALDDPDQNALALYKAMLNNRHSNGRRHDIIAGIGASMVNKDIREMSGIHSTASRMLEVFTDPLVARNTSRSDFKIMDLMNDDKPISLYVVTVGDDKLRLRPLVRLFFNMMFNKLLSVKLRYVNGKPVSPHKHRLLVLIDEFASLRRMEVIEEAMSKCAGFGIKCFLLVQDRQQLIKEYGAEETITSHCQVKIAFAPSNYKTAEWLSDLSGRATIITEDVSESGQVGSSKKSWSKTYHTVSRQLMTPDEIMRLKSPKKNTQTQMIEEPGQVLIHMQGHPIMVVTQCLYFRDPEFCRRVAIQAPPSNANTSRRKTA